MRNSLHTDAVTRPVAERNERISHFGSLIQPAFCLECFGVWKEGRVSVDTICVNGYLGIGWQVVILQDRATLWDRAFQWPWQSGPSSQDFFDVCVEQGQTL